MRKRTAEMLMISLGLCVWVATAAGRAYGQEGDPEAGTETRWTLEKLFERSGVFLVPAYEVRLGPDKYNRQWDFTAPDRGNFTFFDDVSDVGVTEEGALHFTLQEGTATLGWGNYGGVQPRRERVRLWPRFYVRFKARQSMDTTTKVELRFWARGERDPGREGSYSSGQHRKTLEGTEWQDLAFRTWLSLPLRDGFDIEIRGPKGNTIEIKDLAITRYENKGYFRKEITLPDSEIWRAVAEVGAMTHLYINGKQVGKTGKPQGGGEMYGNETVDMAEHLVPGEVNCIAVYGRRHGEQPGYLPYICMQGSVVMTSGERFLVDTDASWVWSREAEEGWNEPGFDQSDWRQVTKERDPDNVTVSTDWALRSKNKTERPVHDGYIRLRNPRDAQLYYEDAEAVVFDILAPRGLAARAPRVEWSICAYEEAGDVPLAQGEAKDFDTESGSIRYTVKAGRLERGVYVLKTRLLSGGDVLDHRMPEVLVVTGRVPMPETEGDRYAQDMDLELERSIDMTDPGDGVWTEGEGRQGKGVPRPTEDPDAGIKEPTIVERGGLTYRVTEPYWGAIVSYQVEFAHPGDWYVMELDYPNDTRRSMGMACCAPSGHQSTATVCTGDRYPLSGRMETLRWVYRPEPGKHALNLVNVMNDARAAGAELRIYHSRNGLAALRAPRSHTRRIGYITERTRADYGRTRFGVLWEDRDTTMRVGRAYKEVEPARELVDLLSYQLDACEHYARYMRFVGQNVLIMGSFQYTQRNPPPYVPGWTFPCARVKGGIRDLFGRVLRDNGIDFYAHVEYVYTVELMQRAAEWPERPEQGFWDTLYMVEPDGEVYMEWQGHYGFNFNHPTVRETMLFTAEDLTRKFRPLSNFKGIVWTPYFGGDWLPSYRGRLKRGPWEPDEYTHYGYGDVTLREFEKDTGSRVPFSLDDRERFSKRHTYLNSAAMRDQWIDWRAMRMKGFFREVAETMHRQREDLKCVCNLYMNPVHDLEWHGSGLSFGDYMLANGWDGKRFAEDPNVSLVHTMYGVLNLNRREPAREYGVGWDMSGHPERYAFFSAEKNRAVHVKHHWSEVEKMSWKLPYREEWPRPHQLTMMYQPDGNHAREVFVRGLIGADADLFFYGFADAAVFEGNEQPLRDFIRVLRVLPEEKFSPVLQTGLGSNLAIRRLAKDGTTWLYVANPGYWPVTGEVVLSGAAVVVDAVRGAALPVEQRDERTVVPVTLEAFGVTAFRTESAEAEVVSWEADAEPGIGTRYLESIVRDTADLLENPAAVAVLRREDEVFMREAVASAREALASERYASALLTTSSDRFWLLKTEYMARGAAYGTQVERGAPVSLERKTAESREASKAPVIDGVLDDAVWEEAERNGGFVSSDGMPAMAGTSFQVVHDEANIYLAVRCGDRNPGEIRMQAREGQEGSVFKDDCIAMFLMPDLEKSVYYQMALSAGGVKFDQEVKGGARNYEFDPSWEAATKVTDKGWIAELRFPVDAFEASTSAESVWGFNMHRRFRGDQMPASSWSYTPGSWHDTRRLGRLEF